MAQKTAVEILETVASSSIGFAGWNCVPVVLNVNWAGSNPFTTKTRDKKTIQSILKVIMYAVNGKQLFLIVDGYWCQREEIKWKLVFQ